MKHLDCCLGQVSGFIHSILDMTESRQLIYQRRGHVLFLLERFVVTDVAVVSVVIIIIVVVVIGVGFLLLFLFTLHYINNIVKR